MDTYWELLVAPFLPDDGYLIYASISKTFYALMRGRPKRTDLIEALRTPALAVWTFDQGCPTHRRISWRLSFLGELEVLKTLCARGLPLGEEVADNAAAEGHLEMLQWVEQSIERDHRQKLVIYMLMRGHLHLLKWAYTKGWFERRTAEHSRIAAVWGQLEILQWMLENNFPMTEDFLRIVVDNKHLHILEWLQVPCRVSRKAKFKLRHRAERDRSKLWNPKYCRYVAIAHNQLDVLKWLYERKPWPLTEWPCAQAAMNGFLEIVQWFHAIGAPITRWTCKEAVHHRRLGVIRWLIDAGVPYDIPELLETATNTWYRYHESLREVQNDQRNNSS
jgi:hypothetical protein